MSINNTDTPGAPTDRERFAGADGAASGYSTLPETPLEITAVAAEVDDMAFIESVSVDWDE